MKTKDRVALDDWYVVASAVDIETKPSATVLLGQDLVIWRDGEQIRVREVDGAELPVEIRYGCVFTTLGAPKKDVVEIA